MKTQSVNKIEMSNDDSQKAELYLVTVPQSKRPLFAKTWKWLKHSARNFLNSFSESDFNYETWHRLEYPMEYRAQPRLNPIDFQRWL